MSVNKRIKIHPDVLIDYAYDDTNVVTESYRVVTNYQENGLKSFLSTTGKNIQSNNIFCVDPVLRKYSVVDADKFAFLQLQDFSTPPIVYDTVTFYFPVNYEFNAYAGFRTKMSTLDYEGKKSYEISNYHYDKTKQTLDLPTPFLYDEKLWGKSITIQIPAIRAVAASRTGTLPTPGSINVSLSDGQGLSMTAPLFIEFAFLSSRATTLGIEYLFSSTPLRTSVPASPEYQNLAVVVEEATDGDYFNIYGTYNGSNEQMDDFAEGEITRGYSLEIRYEIDKFEENIRTGPPVTYVITDNFSQKIQHRPIITFSNTTARLDVTMRVINLVTGGEVDRLASYGMTTELLKYGRSLTRINLDERAIKPKIYKLRPANLTTQPAGDSAPEVRITKVPYPLLVDKYKILVGSPNTNSSDYKSMGLLNLVVTPFDNLIKFQVAQEIRSDGTPVPYDLSSLLSNAKLLLVFKSDTDRLEKDVYYQAGEASFKLGTVTYRLQERDIPILRKIYDKGAKNFYLILQAGGESTMLYSGKYNFYTDLRFVDVKGAVPTAQLTAVQAAAAAATQTTTQTSVDKSVGDKSTYKKVNVPSKTQSELYDNSSYMNAMVYVIGRSNQDRFVAKVTQMGITPYLTYKDVYYLVRVHVNDLETIGKLSYVDQLMKMDIYTGQVDNTVISVEQARKSTTDAQML